MEINMAEKEEIEILVSEEGEIEFLIKGIKGPSCHKVAQELGKILGEIKEIRNTPEYYEKEETKTKLEKKIK
jgi:hypothetical protein